jgi:hypothetical protein
VHGVTFDASTCVKVTDVPVPVYLHGNCVECWRAARANPLAADIGLDERPAYWVADPAYGPSAFRCTYHDVVMTELEACRTCAEEDGLRCPDPGRHDPPGPGSSPELNDSGHIALPRK